MQHDIDTGDHRHIKQAPRCIPLNKRRQVQLILENGIIEPSISACSSQIVLVEKKVHFMRFCVDYRVLNEVTMKDSYPLPHIDDCFDALTGTHWLSSIELQSCISKEASMRAKHLCVLTTIEFRVKIWRQ